MNMNRVALLVVLGVIAVNGAACIGKGKAPPPAAPIEAPLMRKG